MVRIATINDATEIMQVIDDAKELFRNDGSDQWQDLDNYPNINTIKQDIEKQQMYVAIYNKEVVGCVVLSSDYEKAYEMIYEGNWLSDTSYMVIHRIAVRKDMYGKGIAKELMRYVIDVAKSRSVSSIKVDTKIENYRMISLLKKFNFIEVGKIDLLRDDVIDKVRIALELVLN